MLGIAISVSPSATTGEGSWVWTLAAIALVVAVLVAMWIAGLWGRRVERHEPGMQPVASVPSERRAA